MTASTPTDPTTTASSPSSASSHSAPRTHETWDLKQILSTLPPSPPSSAPQPHKTLYLLHLLHRLKTTRREGWQRHGVTPGESISDHMYRMSLICMFTCPAEVKREKAMMLALVHDMAELLVGDITPLDGVSKEEKGRRELESMKYLSSLLPVELGEELLSLWQEYELGSTPEARFVKDVDKLELLVQMVDYERMYSEEKLDLGEFWHVARGVKGELREFVPVLEEERRGIWKGRGRPLNLEDAPEKEGVNGIENGVNGTA